MKSRRFKRNSINGKNYWANSSNVIYLYNPTTLSFSNFKKTLQHLVDNKRLETKNVRIWIKN